MGAWTTWSAACCYCAEHYWPGCYSHPTNHPSFKGTRGWAQKFMRWNDLVLRTKTSLAQKQPAAPNRKHGRNRHVFWHVGQHNSGEEIWTNRAEKHHLTVVLAAIADGQMLPPMVIFMGKRNLKNISVSKVSICILVLLCTNIIVQLWHCNFYRDWIVCVQAKGWMEGDLMKKWIRQVWIKNIQRRKALLMMDSFHAQLCRGHQGSVGNS